MWSCAGAYTLWWTCFTALILTHSFEVLGKRVNDQRSHLNMPSCRELPGVVKDKLLRCFFLNELQKHAGTDKLAPLL